MRDVHVGIIFPTPFAPDDPWVPFFVARFALLATFASPCYFIAFLVSGFVRMFLRGFFVGCR